MTDLVLKELRLRHAQLEHHAEKLRVQWRAATSTGPRALSLGKQVKEAQRQADAWARLIEKAEELL